MRLFKRIAILPILTASLMIAACGEEAIDDGSDDETGGASGEHLFPLVDGAHWTYVVQNADQMTTDTTSGQMSAGEDADTFILLEGSDETTMARDGDRTVRLSKINKSGDFVENMIDYDPNFVRADDAWKTAAEGDTFDYEFTETVTDENGENPDAEARAHQFTIMSTAEDIETSAELAFTTVHVRRETMTGDQEGNVVEFWFAPGVGLVQMRQRANPGLMIEEEWEKLLDYNVPEAE